MELTKSDRLIDRKETSLLYFQANLSNQIEFDDIKLDKSN